MRELANKRRLPGLHWLGQLWHWLALSLLFMSATAHCEIWTFVDERGVTRFAAEQVDPRYALFFLALRHPAAVRLSRVPPQLDYATLLACPGQP